jgi:ATP-dependent helicase Lhr and Lhr-like helicase
VLDLEDPLDPRLPILGRTDYDPQVFKNLDLAAAVSVTTEHKYSACRMSCGHGRQDITDVRLQRYCALLGRRSALWHGNVTTSARRKVLRDPPDCLLTTPESLEVMLVSPNVDARGLFCNLRAVIVDEIHAFAGDDRGWHLLSVLQRVARLAGRELQWIGLSATVGNPEMLIDWLAGSCKGEHIVFRPAEASSAQTEVKLDYVGSLENVALVISRLHRGEKRLVFIDSRARAQELGAGRRQLGITAFVTHSSLSQEQRRQAEDAFANRDDCVIVATSVLELGVDVDNLDRVIQIDSPTTVSSFLQRMGRTRRRQGAIRNCLFLATRAETLVQAAGLIDLWHEGYVEPIHPPAEPYHVLAQQLMALVLQERGIGRYTWREWVARVPAFADMPLERIDEVVTWMLTQGILWEEQGILGIGQKGEETHGQRHFMELLSVFLSPPTFARKPCGTGTWGSHRRVAACAVLLTEGSQNGMYRVAFGHSCRTANHWQVGGNVMCK